MDAADMQGVSVEIKHKIREENAQKLYGVACLYIVIQKKKRKSLRQ